MSNTAGGNLIPPRFAEEILAYLRAPRYEETRASALLRWLGLTWLADRFRRYVPGAEIRKL